MFPDPSHLKYGLLVLAILTLPVPLMGQELKLAPSLVAKEEYNDNILLTTYGKQGDFITTVTPSLELSSRTERRDAKLSGGVNWLTYARHSADNAVDYFGSGAFGYKLTPRLDFSAGAGYMRNSRPDQIDAATGLSVNSGSGYQSYQAGGNYIVTERGKLSLSYGYNREDFDRPDLLGTRQHQAVGGFSYTLTPVLNLVEQFTYNRQLTDVSRVDNYSATIGLTRKFSELWGFSLSAGGSYSRSGLNVTRLQTVSNGQWGWVGALSFLYTGEKLNGSVSFNHDVSTAVGRSGSTERTGGNVTLGERFTEDFSGSVRAGYYLNKSNPGQYSLQLIDEKTLDLGCSLNYSVSRYVALEARYNYLHIDYSQTRTQLDQNIVMLLLTFKRAFFL